MKEYEQYASRGYEFSVGNNQRIPVLNKRENSCVSHACIQNPENGRCVSYVEPYLGKIDVKEVEKNYGVRLDIPRMFLFGTQASLEYTERKRKAVEARFKKCGSRKCLEENPPLTIFLPGLNDSRVVILNGHHRIREAGQKDYGGPIENIPTLVITLDEWTEIYNAAFPENPKSREELEDEVNANIRETLESFENSFKFSKNGSKKHHPQAVCEVTSMEQMRERFGQCPLTHVRK